MAESLRDQLLKSGIVKQVRDDKRASAPGKGARPAPRGKPAPKGKPQPRSQEEIDLARAYALRAQTEAAERRHAEQEAAEQARLRRERRAKLQQLLEGQALNRPDAEHVRHFEYGGKIRRVHVDAGQLAALNAGTLGVVQQNGRYLVVSRAVAEQARAIDPHALALLVDPSAPREDDDGVPADLMW
ncbi:DUF2058 domain-containing protein [Fulvimonas soli]|jgi:uncharacterized protein YaiL (DUF2058 family)|uniref:Uncharacterized protein YaiL (DUF2058 family) n=1 Tax=Fulvimonas soli TaxID=155197 RepID=A0A316II18_9GAMM|nr:DUF2058 family protein [Fulvimonas soli]PWK93031.1 uncharacterized protein YaiL (DUF2058 family) [Fulvimonas soli]TNY26395.1 nucleoprotein/polynucleotide-associated enzyme [Fulvimonas soli]